MRWKSNDTTGPTGSKSMKRGGMWRGGFRGRSESYGGTRKCRFFATEAERERFIEAFQEQLSQNGTSLLLGFDPAKMRRWQEAARLAPDADPVEVMRFWLAHNRPILTPKRLSEEISTYLRYLKAMNRAEAYRNRKREEKGLDRVKWKPKCPPKNCFPHSSATYHVALSLSRRSSAQRRRNRDAGKTALIMSHRNQQVLVHHFIGVATKATAEQYFAILPGK